MTERKIFAIGIILALIAFMPNYWSSFKLYFLLSGVTYFLGGLVISSWFKGLSSKLIMYLFLPKILHDVLGILVNREIYPEDVPITTLSCLLNLIFASWIYKKNKLHIGSMLAFAWLTVFCSLAFSFAGYLFLWNNATFDLAAKPRPYRLVQASGNTITSDVHHGKVVLLDYWSEYCISCVRQFPNIQKLYDQYSDSPDVEIISVHVGDEDQLIKQSKNHPHKRGFTFPVASDQEAALFDKLKLWGVPQLVLIDKQGNWVLHHQGYSHLDEGDLLAPFLAQEIEKLR